MGIPSTDELDAEYTSIDLNSTGTTTVYSVPDNDITDGARIFGVHLRNGGSSAQVRLEVTDGSSTAALAEPGAGSSLHFEGDAALGDADELQINVTTAEGAAQTNTAVVLRGERT